MTYAITIRQEATNEFSEAYVWYEEQKEGLGKEFQTSLQNKFNLVRKNPFHYKTVYKKFHQVLIDRFPFLIVYSIDEKNKHITVFAIFHTSRNPKKKFSR